MISTQSYYFVLINRFGAELVTNLHTFMIIVPNHTGPDLHINEHHAKSREEQVVQQIMSTCNYSTGGYWNDYLHGYLNYQIEHHLFPTFTPLQYTKIQKQVKDTCKKHGVNYIQESVFCRIKKMFLVISHDIPMKVR